MKKYFNNLSENDLESFVIIFGSLLPIIGMFFIGK
jgi:hypothetical protein